MTVDVATTRAHLRRLDKERAARGAARRRELEAQLPEALDVLREKGADRVWVFGSVVTGDTTPASDLDLAVEGLPGRQYFPALGELSRRLSCEVDLVRMEHLEKVQVAEFDPEDLAISIEEYVSAVDELLSGS